MEEIIQYLQMKNLYYEKFYSISVKFLEQAEQDRWDDLEFFVDNRERILNIIRSFDFKIQRALEATSDSTRKSAYYGKCVRELLGRRSALAQKIVQIDLELISRIDELKSETVRELKRNVETNQHLDTFEKSAATRQVRKPSRDA